MILILWVLGIVIVALLIRLLLNSAPTNGKPFLLRTAVVIIAIVEMTNFMNDDTFWDAVTPDPIEESTDYFYYERY